MALENLIHNARLLRKEDQRDHELAQALRLEAMQFYGTDCRSADFINIITLASEIDQKQAQNWEQKINILVEGELPASSQEGNFSVGKYAVGNVDLYLDGVVKNRISSVSLALKPTRKYASKLRGGLYVINLMEGRGNRKKKFQRAMDLHRHLLQEIGNPLYNFSVIEEQISPLITNCISFNYDTLSMDMDTLDLSYPANINDWLCSNVDHIGGFIGKHVENPRCIASVRDGGSKYKK